MGLLCALLLYSTWLVCVVSAQSASAQACSSANYATVTAPAQLASLASCDTYIGSMTLMLSQPSLATGTAASWSLPVATIDGDLTVVQTGAIGGADGFILDISQLAFVRNFTIANVNPENGFNLVMGTLLASDVILNSVIFQSTQFPALPDQGLYFLDSFTAEYTNLAAMSVSRDSITPGIALPSVFIVQNTNLNEITLSIGTVASLVRISENGPQCSLYCGVLTQACLYISGVYSLEAPNLSYMFNASTPSRFSQNTFSELELPSLSYAAMLEIENNEYLSSLQLYSLEEVGMLSISGNSLLAELELPRISAVAHSVSISGPFTSVAIPSASRIKGTAAAITIDSAKTMNCDARILQQERAGIVTGSFTCESGKQTGAPQRQSGLSVGAQAGIAVAVITLVLATAAGALAWFRRRRRARMAKLEEVSEGQELETLTRPELESIPIRSYEKDAQATAVYELSAGEPEMAGDSPRHELAAGRRYSES